MRRAGFGARYDEMEAMAARGYDATVDWLPHPEGEPEVEEEVPLRFSPGYVDPGGVGASARFAYRNLNTRRPLEEKVARAPRST